MPYRTLIATNELADHLADPEWVIVDCRFQLSDTGKGEKDYIRAHIPGAQYAHLDRDLSGPIIPGVTGRHPWPTVEAAADYVASLGIGAHTQVVAYDDDNSEIAGRLWWLLRWLGHADAAVLDGGWRKWQAEGRPTASGVETRAKRVFNPEPRHELVLDATQVAAIRSDPTYVLVDSRAPERYRGDIEPIDPVAGHIAGARNLPYAANLNPDMTFQPAPALQTRFRTLLGDLPAERAVFYCGSGVTAVHNLLAMLHAGVGEGRLYGGSWSDWITDSARPVAVGE